MANLEHLAILKQGVEVWNKWREDHPEIKPDLTGADLRGEDFSKPKLDQRHGTGKYLRRLVDARRRNIDPALFGLDLHGADLSGARLNETNLRKAYLSKAILKRAKLTQADLREVECMEADLTEAKLVEADLRNANCSLSTLFKANLQEANLRGANLGQTKMRGAILAWADLRKAHLDYADLTEADLSYANLAGSTLLQATLTGANLTQSQLVRTELGGAKMAGCRVFGTSVWQVGLGGAIQKELIITRSDEAEITVDNLEVAQFVYLLLNNEKIGDIIGTIGKKGVLIIGRFTEERKAILHAIRDELRDRYNLLPIMFEFSPLSNEPTIKTLSTLAHLSRFVIADLTDAKSVLQELTTILKDLPTLPVKPIIHESDLLPPMGDSFLIMQSMLKPYVYTTKEKLLSDLQNEVIDPAEDCVKRFETRLAEIRQEWFPWQRK